MLTVKHASSFTEISKKTLVGPVPNGTRILVLDKDFWVVYKTVGLNRPVNWGVSIMAKVF